MLIKQYRQWLETSDFNFERFNRIAKHLLEFLLGHRLDDQEFTKEVASKFMDVLARCDEIDYQEDSTATAYGILHFLNRYHRFQLNFVKMIEHGYLPTRRYEMDFLDVGTGPGPALYALSDAYLSLRKFGESVGYSKLKSINFRSDYVERSDGFRSWLHHLTESANYNEGKHGNHWLVPYHHGTFGDFKDISFNQISGVWGINEDGEYEIEDRVIKHRFNLIIFSNFLTNLTQVESIEQELKNCMRYLRNKGKLIVVGGVGGQYPELYKKLEQIIVGENYNTWKFYASSKKLKIRQSTLRFSYDDRYGKVIKDFNKKIIERFEHHKALDHIPQKAREVFLKSVEDQYSYENKWNMHVFEKFARIKAERFRKNPIRRK